VQTEDDLAKLETLIGSEVLGLDIEWRPQITKFESTRPALLQISNSSHCCLVDLISMGESVMLNLTLSTMFQDPKTTLVGLAFRADLTRIRT
jgi:hypothetical protein